MLLLVASSAILIPLVLIAGFRMPARYGMAITALAVVTLALLMWQMSGTAVWASVIQGVHRAVTILWILAGAMLLVNTLRTTGALERINTGLVKISPDMRVQIVLIGFLFVSLLEGLAGFGSPVAIAAPLLVALGFRPIAAVVLTLIGDTVAVAFGAVGTPILVGMSNLPPFTEPGFLSSIATNVARIDVLVASLLPVLMVAVLVRSFGEHADDRSWYRVAQIAPWALCVGVAYAVAMVVYAHLVSPEIVSILAALTVLVPALITAKYDIGLPRASDWRTHLVKPKKASRQTVRMRSLVKAWVPYALVVILLIITRLVPPVRDMVTSVLDAGLYRIAGIEAINSAWLLLNSPGTLLLIAAIIGLLLGRVSWRQTGQAFGQTGQLVVISAMALVPTLIVVQVFINSGINSAELAAMPAYIGERLADVFGGYWLVIAPVVGAIGAFIAGSSTVSTLTMSPIQYDVALSAKFDPEFILAQQLSGASAGNMIAIHNIVAASTVVGLYHQEGRVIRRLLWVVGVYLILSVIGALIWYTMM